MIPQFAEQLHLSSAEQLIVSSADQLHLSSAIDWIFLVPTGTAWDSLGCKSQVKVGAGSESPEGATGVPKTAT
ncbi:MAG: hypothetical protein KDA51_03650 [Planctomycetales bacterium]|nr:hypothetical protein [Planctomycetales bacterium]